MKLQKLVPHAAVPTCGTPGAACFDLRATEEVSIAPRSAEEIGTGLAFEVPEGHVMLVFSRSGHGFKNGLRLANSVGVIDSDYRGEVRVKLHNDSHNRQHVVQGDRIAQAMVLPVARMSFELADALSDTERGAGGIGSTGVQ